MQDLVLLSAMFLLGTTFGIALSELIAYACRASYIAKKKKQDKMTPLLGVVLPSEKDKK